MKNKRLLGLLSIPLVAIGFRMSPAVAQEQICIRVNGPLFSVSYHDPSSEDPDPLGGWICRRSSDPDAPPANVLGMRGFLLNVGSLQDLFGQDDYSSCFQDQNCPNPDFTVCDYDLHDHSDVMTGTIQILIKKNKPVNMVHWEHGLDTSETVEVLYMVQYADGTIDSGTLPPGSNSTTVVLFNDLLVETEGRGKLKNSTCKGQFWGLGGSVEVERCEERPENPFETNGLQDENGDVVLKRPLPCCCTGTDCSACN